MYDTKSIKINKKGNPIDILTVVNELKSRAELEIVGGAYYVSTLTNRVVGSHNIEYHSRIIQQKYIQRELIRLSTETIRDCFEDSCDPLDAIDIHEKGLTQITLGISKGREAQTVADVWHELEEKNTALLKRDGVIGVPSGLTEIDKLTGGWQKSDLIVIAARPAMGKTALVLCMARNAALDFRKPTLVFSLEMSTSQLVTRLVASETKEYIKSFTRNGIEPSKFFEHQRTCSKFIFYLFPVHKLFNLDVQLLSFLFLYTNLRFFSFLYLFEVNSTLHEYKTNHQMSLYLLF